MANQKELLRSQLKAARRAMNPQDVSELSRLITDRVRGACDWSDVRSLHAYQPLFRHREVDTRPLIKELKASYPDMKIAIWEDLFGTHLPLWLTQETGRPIPKDFQFDLILVPLLGFNDACHRIGFGGGFYDRFLAVQKHAMTIGLCYESGHVRFEPENHDIALDLIITEKAIHSTK